MEKLTIREYATRFKLSTFNVVKMTRSGELKIETVKQDDKEVVLICVEPEEVVNDAPKKSERKNESRALRAENMSLKKEIARLKEVLAECQKRSKSID